MTPEGSLKIVRVASQAILSRIASHDLIIRLRRQWLNLTLLLGKRRNLGLAAIVASMLIISLLLLIGSGPSQSTDKMWTERCRNGGSGLTAFMCARRLPKRPATVAKKFIYVYDIPREYNKHVMDLLRHEWLFEEVNGEQFLYR